MQRNASVFALMAVVLALVLGGAGCDTPAPTPTPSTSAASTGSARAPGASAQTAAGSAASPHAGHSGHATASAQAVTGPPPRGKMIELSGSAGKVGAYLSEPASARGSEGDGKEPAGKRPAILVIQEWWGLEDWIKRNADRFADQGYVALAVDLYRGKVTKDPGEAHELMRGLPEDRALADLKAGFAQLAARPDVDPARIGAIGWCMGGGFALKLATAEPKLKATVVNYGQLLTDKATLAKVQASLLGNFAGQDRGIPPADVKQFEEAMKAAKKDVDIKVYDPNGHAFMNPGNAEGYDEKATADAWSRIDAFFTKKLKG